MSRARQSTAQTDPPARKEAPLPAPAADPARLFERAQAYVGFTEKDSALLAAFRPKVQPYLDDIVEDFYSRIQADPEALKVITGGPKQIARLKGLLRDWLDRTLKGPHDAEWARLQSLIGRRHVAVGLDQAYMVTGVNVFREHMNRILFRLYPQRTPHSLATQRAFVRAFDIVLALMLETFREDSVRKVLQAEQNATFRRLAALGEVAASIAHEIRNPLAGISGAIQILEQEMQSDTRHREVLREVLDHIRRLDERINDLLLYARPSPLSRTPVKPRDLLETTVRLLGDDPLFKKIRIEITASRRLPPFPLDAAQIQQVIVNLVLNAIQAMNGAGTVRLMARAAGTAGLEICVEDEGPGVPPHIAEEIFKPFFTTRVQGTGLGLPISRKIVESHNGSIRLEKTRSGGARFCFVLPPPIDEPSPHSSMS